MMETLKKLFLPSVVDEQVESINKETSIQLQDAAKVAKSHAALLRKNGVTLQILTSAGADKHD